MYRIVSLPPKCDDKKEPRTKFVYKNSIVDFAIVERTTQYAFLFNRIFRLFKSNKEREKELRNIDG